MPRATKIVATLGPACSDPTVLHRMIAAGVDVVRLNFSHGSAEDHLDRARLVREIGRSLKREVGVMADLQGPKIRVGKFAEGKVTLEPGQRFVLDAECELGDKTRVGLDYKELPQDVSRDSVLLLNDGLIKLSVEEVDGPRIITRVILGGVLLIGAGVFQFTPLKRNCLTRCRGTLEFILTRWREGRSGAFRMGLEHGTFCTACCWALMALLFVAGVMNILWVAVLTLLVCLEKILPARARVSFATGIVLAGWGVFILGTRYFVLVTF